MRVLWVVNKPLPEAMSLLQGVRTESDSTGSWKCALADAMEVNCRDVSLAVAAPSALVDGLVVLKGGYAVHYVFPSAADNRPQVPESVIDRISDSFNPDVVHVHGTEYGCGLPFLRRFPDRTVVSMQGLISEIFKYYYGGIPEKDILKFISVRDIVRRDTLVSQKRRMEKRSGTELEILRSARYVIGRTGWDRSVSEGINPSARYYHCDEMLRDPFYSGRWSYGTCSPHSIFVSQGYYPLKGLHKLIEAMPGVLKSFPDAHVRVSGPNVLRGKGLKNRLLLNGYGRYLLHLVRRNGLEGRLNFIGPCNAERVKEEMLSANVIVCPSAIENSSNSICEAQMLGVPVIASDVGGTKTLIPDESCGRLYEYDDTEALAKHISDVFSNPGTDGSGEIRLASERHNRQKIINQLMSIYEDIFK